MAIKSLRTSSVFSFIASPFKSLSSSLKLPLLITLIVITLIATLTPNNSIASSAANISKTSTADFDAGTNSNTNTTGDEVKVDPNAKYAWYNDLWLYRKKITIDHTKVSTENQTDFPVLINLATDADLAARAQDDGDDILLTSDDEKTKLSHEIESFNGTTGALVLWVKVPTLSYLYDTTLWLYYGNAAATSQQNAIDVWSNGYVGVWHLKDGTVLNTTDSVGNFNLTNSGTIAAVASAKINGGATNFSPNQALTNAGGAALNTTDWTAEGWVYRTATPGYANSILGHTQTTANPGHWFFYSDASNKLSIDIPYVKGDIVHGATTVAFNAWSHVVATKSGNNYTVFYNGQSDGTATDATAPTVSGSIYSGNTANLNQPMQSSLDDIRISNTARSAGWIATEYNNQNDPGSFYALGSEQAKTSLRTTTTSQKWYTIGATEQTAWKYRRQITIDHTKVPNTNQTEFPMLVKIVDETDPLFTKAQADGDDILFTDKYSNYKLAHEIETFNASAGSRALWAWVKIPTLAAATDTTIWLYYGNSGATNQQSATAVWSNGYAGVWHLDEASGNFIDSTTNPNDCSISGAITRDATGKLNKAVSLTRGNYLTCGNNSSLDLSSGISMQFWANNGDASRATFMARASRYQWVLENGYDLIYTPNMKINTYGSYASHVGQWAQYNMTFDLATAKVYINGEYKAQKVAADTLGSGANNFQIGQGSNGAGYGTTGTIDEVRLSSSVRGVDWIATEYNNQNSPETFASISKETGYYPISDTSSWYSTSWSSRQLVTIDHTKVPNTDQTDFPVLVKITNQSNGVFASAQADGDDILFTSSNGTTKLSHEIESFSTTAGSKALWAWVKVPTLSHTTDTTLYLYYGNAAATSQQNATDVWSNGYVGVWHLKEDQAGTGNADLYQDSTSSNNDADDYVAETTKTGKIGSGQKLNGTSDYMKIPSNASLNFGTGDFTVTFWINSDNTATAGLIGKRSGGRGYTIRKGTNHLWFVEGDAQVNQTAGAVSVGSWQHLAYRIQSQTLASWLNSVNAGGAPTYTGTIDNSIATEFGRYDTGSAYFAGYFDEIKISNIARSADWIATEYNNQNSPETFESFGIEQSNVSYASPTTVGGGIIDTTWNGGWGTPSGFASTVTIPSNTSIHYQMRSSAVGGSSDGDWTSWYSLGTATSSGTFSVATASMPAGITTGTNRYLQTKAILTSSDGTSTPTLADYTIYYLADTDAPTNPTTTTATVGGTPVTTATWASSSTSPVFTFSGASDGGAGESGVAGYYIYYGTNASADPATYQAHVGAAGDNQTYNAVGAVDGSHYYFRVKTADIAGNISSAATLFDLGFDTTSPTRPTFASADPAGYTTVNSFDFSWPAGTDPNGAGGGTSDIKWYEYKRATDVSWSHTANAATRTVADLTAYQEGVNAFYVRSVDNAGNVSSNYQQVTYYYSGVAPDKPTGLEVSPDTSDSNSFTIHWHKPTVDPEDPPVVGYYYSINATPTVNNVTYKASTSDTTTIGPDAFATLQGVNTIYVLAVNSAGNYSLDASAYASKTFICQTPAQPAPSQVSLTDSSDSDLSRWMLTLQWAAGSGQTSAFDHYIIYRSTDGQGFSQLATTSSTAYIDASGLNNSTTYYYNIKAVDNAGKEGAQSSTVSKIPTGKYLTPPSYLNSPTVSNIKSSSAKISWITDRSSSSIVRYGKSTTSLDASSGQMDSSTNHEVELTGLEAGALYYFQVQSLDEHRDYSPTLAYSSSYNLQTLAAPTISNVEVSNITLSSADISWETTTVSSSSLYYGKNYSFASKLDDVSGSSATKHSVKLTNLDHSTRYNFRVTATDIDGNDLVSDNYIFETLPMPRVENLKTTLIQDKARPAAKINWTTNVDTSSIVKYSIDGKDPKEETKSKLQKEHEIIVENLQDQTNYKIEVSGRDSLGNLADTTTASLKTPDDKRPPVILDISIETSNVGLNKEDKAQMVVSWTTDEPATSRVEYGLGLGSDNYEKMTSEDSNLSTSHVVIISDLDPTSPYHIRINSKDGSGNLASSQDQTVISSEVQKSTLRILLDALTKAFSWIKL